MEEKRVAIHLRDRLAELKEAKKKGVKIIGYFPGDYVPEEIIYASGAVPLCLAHGESYYSAEAALSVQEVRDMTTQEKLIKRKQSILELTEYLQNVSQVCKIHGGSRQHFYDTKKTYEEQGLEGLRETSRRKPCLKNRVATEIEEAVGGKIQRLDIPLKEERIGVTTK